MARFQPKISDVIVGVDFGTTRTAVAYTIVGKSNDIINVIPPGKAGTFLDGNPKTPTSLLMKGDQTEGFGCCAEEKFARHGGDDDDDDQKWRLYKHFKMALYNPYTSNPDVHAVGDPGSLPLSTILMESLKYLTENTMQYLKDISVLKSGNALDVFWVLTVPAIWSDYAKSMMRQAAYMAGMISNQNSHKLKLVLEPECAAVASQMWEVGTRFMIADCGGGTLDITCHEILQTSPLKLKEIRIPSGGLFGAKCVDDEFFEFVAKFLGNDKYEEMVQNHTFEHFELSLEWERRKMRCNFDPVEDKWIEINLSDILDALDMKSEDLAALVTTWNTANPFMTIAPIKRKKKRIQMSLDLMESFFVGTVSRILEAIPVAAVGVENLKYVVLAGGFGKCSLIKTGKIKTFEGTTIEVIRAKEPDLCIVKGAVMFGCSKEALVTSRKSKYTFGVAASIKFNPELREHIENEHEKYIAEREERLDIFSVHGHVGDDLSCQTHPRLFYSPMALDQNVINVRVLVTEEYNVFLEYEPGARTLCTITIYLQDMMGLPYEDRGVWVEFSFGEEEVNCRVFHSSSKKELESFEVDFQFF